MKSKNRAQRPAALRSAALISLVVLAMCVEALVCAWRLAFRIYPGCLCAVADTSMWRNRLLQQQREFDMKELGPLKEKAALEKAAAEASDTTKKDP